MTRLIIAHGDYEHPESLAGVMRSLARTLRADEATTFTNDAVFEALTELRNAADQKVNAAVHVRGSRRRSRA